MGPGVVITELSEWSSQHKSDMHLKETYCPQEERNDQSTLPDDQGPAWFHTKLSSTCYVSWFPFIDNQAKCYSVTPQTDPRQLFLRPLFISSFLLEWSGNSVHMKLVPWGYLLCTKQWQRQAVTNSPDNPIAYLLVTSRVIPSVTLW